MASRITLRLQSGNASQLTTEPIPDSAITASTPSPKLDDRSCQNQMASRITRCPQSVNAPQLTAETIPGRAITVPHGLTHIPNLHRFEK